MRSTANGIRVRLGMPIAHLFIGRSSTPSGFARLSASTAVAPKSVSERDSQDACGSVSLRFLPPTISFALLVGKRYPVLFICFVLCNI